jgi:hypothetical protein
MTAAAEPTYPNDNAYLMMRIAGDLAPNLSDKPQDHAPALRMAWKMVQAYHPGDESEATAATRIVALSMTQLDLLRECTKPDLTPAMKLRTINAAVRINREINQTDRALQRRQLAEERRPIAQQPVEPERSNRSSNKPAVDEAMIAEALREAARMDAHRRQQAAATSAQAEPVRPEPPLSKPVAHPAEPAAPPAGQAATSPHAAEAARAFFRRTEDAHANHHAALAAAAAARGQGLRTPGAGSPPPSAKAAAPG